MRRLALGRLGRGWDGAGAGPPPATVARTRTGSVAGLVASPVVGRNRDFATGITGGLAAGFDARIVSAGVKLSYFITLTG